MIVVMKKVRDLIPYNKNPRKNDEAVKFVANSIKEFGFKVPIVVDRDNVIVAGHTRMKAAIEIGLEEVPVIVADDLTDEQIKAFRLADNKTGEIAEWDFEMLDDELHDLAFDFDMSEFGFDVGNISDEDETEIVEDDIPEEIETRCKLGDIWQLGNHRLICGDSTSPDTFEKLMDGVTADITITSPPYNADHMDVEASQERGGKIDKSTLKKYLADNDKRTDDEYFEFLKNNIDLLLDNSHEIFYNIGVAAGSKKTIGRLLSNYSEQFKELMYWVKDNPVPVIVESVISSATELIICFGKNGTRSFKHFNDRLFHGVINGHSAALSNEYADIHKATFPVYLPYEIIKRFTDENGSVIDCFGGTGTTMIACEQLNRKCYIVELDPRYCDVIIQRWENFTGKKAVRADV